MSNGNLSPTNVGAIGIPPSQNNGNQSGISTSEQNRIENLKNAKSQFSTWIMGFVVSLIPLFILPILKISNGNEFSVAFNGFFSNPELFFIGISITVAAANDFVNNSRTFSETLWFQINMVMILLGTLIYTLIIVQTYYKPDENNNTMFTIFTIFYLGVTFGLGCIRYIKNINKQKG